jgi:Ca-activated chloride channel family protein
MTESTEGAFCLRAAADDGVHPVLAGVKAQGRLNGLLFSLTLRQTYRNTSRRTLEVVYTFPLPLSAVLLGFAAEFSGRRVDCEVMPCAQAEEVYENALADGDAPALLEAGPDGLYTANIGNLKRGEEVVLEIRFAQLVAFEQGRLRLAVPMTIAPRYGNPESSGLHPHQVPEASILADYPLELSVQVAGDLAAGGVECPTHPTRCTPFAGGLEVALAEGARMDRDVVLLVTPQEARPQVLSWSQGVAVAAFELPVAPKAEGSTGLALKLLVDCSGSMGGDSIASARRALMGVMAGLSQDDEVSLTRFGSDAELALAPQRCTPQVLERLGEAVEATDATLGGTEMEAALLGVFALPSWLPPAASSKARKGQDRARAAQQAPCCADVLLITDGEVWDTKRMIASAQRSGHRVFVIGVGTSPAEAVLRHLAEATGGACEFATPGEALEAAAERMLQRMRQSVWTGLRVDWGMAEAPQWELPVQQRAFGGDTLLALGGFAAAGGPEATEGAESAPATGRLESSRGPVALGGPRDVRLLARGADGQEVEIGRVSTVAAAAGDDLARIAAARRVAALDALSSPDDMTVPKRMDEAVQAQEPSQQARALALEHRLISRHTHGVLVHRRAEADKPKDESLLHRVQSMLAAGWGNTGRVASPQGAVSDFARRMRVGPSSGGMKIAASAMRSSVGSASLGTPSVWRSARTQVHALVDTSMDDIEIPAFLRRQADHDDAADAPGNSTRYTTLAEMSGAIADHLARGGLVQDLPTLAQGFQIEPALEPAYRQALEELRDITDDEPSVWLLLALWVAQRPGPDGSPAMAAVLVGPVTQAALTPSDIGQAWQALQQHLGQVSSQAPSSAKPSRRQRLAAALSDAGD